ncbi:MAG: hypothetical protein J0I12_18845 [Candidatus Eremiobacteraeota bacterium]|nr:hypothetical protein [Candidatus Eremiobacteraeota bacterium]
MKRKLLVLTCVLLWLHLLTTGLVWRPWMGLFVAEALLLEWWGLGFAAVLPLAMLASPAVAAGAAGLAALTRWRQPERALAGLVALELMVWWPGLLVGSVAFALISWEWGAPLWPVALALGWIQLAGWTGQDPWSGLACLLVLGFSLRNRATRAEPTVDPRVQEEILRRATLQEQALVLDRLLDRLRRAANPGQAAEALLDGFASSLRLDNVSLVLEEEGRMVFAGSRNSRPLAESELPPMLEIWRGRRPLESSGRLLLPFEQGVVVLERSEAFDAEEMQRAARLTGMAGLGLGLMRRQHAISLWADRLLTLVQGARRLQDAQDPSLVSEQLETLARGTIPHLQGLLCDEQGRPSRFWPQPFAFEEGALRRLLLKCGSGTALEESCLAAAIRFEGGQNGFVVLWGGEFRREQANLLAMIATLGAAALSQAHLYGDLRQALEQLQTSQARLLEASKLAAVGQLAASVAHELNSPLGAVLLSLESAASQVEKRPQVAVQRLETAASGARQCQSIVKNLLAYCAPQPDEWKDLDVHEVLAETLLLTQGDLQSRGVEVVLRLAESAPIRGQSGPLQQLFTNLLVNARDALVQRPNPRVLVSSQVEDGRVLLRVEDNGSGMEEAVRERACEAFFTTKALGEGTGLGLALSQEIVQAHGGSLRLSSQPGVGTRAEVELPLR